MRIRPSIAAAVGLSTFTLYSVVLPGIAEAATYPVTPTPTPPAASTYSAMAQADVLHLAAAGLVGGANPLLGAYIGEAKGQLVSPQADPDGSDAWRAKAFGGGLSAMLAGQLGSPAYAVQTAGDGTIAGGTKVPAPDNTAGTEFHALDVPQLSPLADVAAITTTAEAHWNSWSSCNEPSLVPSTSSATTTDLTVVGGTLPITGTELPALLKLPGEVAATQTIDLTDDGGQTVTAKANVIQVELLGGLIKLGVSQAPTLTTTVNGRPGGASVTYAQPVITVGSADGSTSYGTLDGSNPNLSLRNLPGLSTLLGVLAPLADIELSLGQLSTTVAGDGTAASGDAALLHVSIKLLDVSAIPGLNLVPGLGGFQGLTLLDADVVPLHAEAAVPVGGIACGDDSDGDGISNALESANGMDAYDPDENDNGVRDDVDDVDGDTLTNLQELTGSANTTYGDEPTDPKAADTDDDGVSDSDEITGARNDGSPTDPNNADTDGDGVLDGVEATNGTDATDPADPAAVDTDGDGLNDIREGELGTSPTNPDTDGDGLSDGVEVASGYDPNDASDPDQTTDSDGDGLSDYAELTGDPATDPHNPDTDGDGVGDKEELISTPATDPTKADTDGDGLTDGFEVSTSGTDPTVADTDHGGVDDGDEWVNGTNPLVASDDHGVAQDPDADGDGLTNATEASYGTNPNRADSDGDGLDDKAEILTYKTDPLVADTDHDGLADGSEVAGNKVTSRIRVRGSKKVKKVTWVVRTNPRDADTDHDGLSDIAEVTGSKNLKKWKRLPTNPLVADTDRDGLTDGQEVLRYRSNPLDWDTDKGGRSDGWEVKRGWSPLKKGKLPPGMKKTRR